MTPAEIQAAFTAQLQINQQFQTQIEHLTSGVMETRADRDHRAEWAETVTQTTTQITETQQALAGIQQALAEVQQSRLAGQEQQQAILNELLR